MNVPPVSPCSERRLRGSDGFSAGVVDPCRATAEVPPASTHWPWRAIVIEAIEMVRTVCVVVASRATEGNVASCLSPTPTPSGSAIISRPLPAVLDDEDA